MNDLISRQAAIRWIKTECNPYGKPTIDYESGVKVIDHIETMPSAEVEPVKHGRWKGKPIAGYSTVRCSVCGEVYTENNGRWLYCPNCGAKMIYEAEEE